MTFTYVLLTPCTWLSIMAKRKSTKEQGFEPIELLQQYADKISQ
jgi:hypothetical protein